MLEIVHTDLNVPNNTAGHHGEIYFLSFIDTIANWLKFIVAIRTKDEVYEYLVQFVNAVQNLTGKMIIKKLRCYMGTMQELFGLQKKKE